MRKLFAIVPALLLWAAGITEAQNLLLPPIPDWKLTIESRVYDSNDLWDIIDGAADLYLEYAFVDLHIARYTTGNKREVKVELYHHGDAENAFGMYAAERSPEYNFISIGAQGYQQTSVLNFVDGEFYLRLSSYQNDSASRTDLLTIARAIEKHLNRNASLPPALRLFPLQGKLLNSEQFIAQNFLGYGFLRSVYAASYAGSAPFKAFIIGKKTRAEADTLMKEYFSKMPKENIASPGKDRFTIQDPNNGPVSLAVEGTCIYGTLNCADEAANNELMAALKINLSRYVPPPK